MRGRKHRSRRGSRRSNFKGRGKKIRSYGIARGGIRL